MAAIFAVAGIPSKYDVQYNPVDCQHQQFYLTIFIHCIHRNIPFRIVLRHVIRGKGDSGQCLQSAPRL